MLKGLDHIAIIVSSEESLKFYERFGFREFERYVRDHDIVVFMECAGIELEIFIDPNHPARVTGPEAMGLRHLAFAVDDLSWVLEIPGCEPVREDWVGRKFTFVKDPDGLPIEVKEARKK